MGLGHKIKQLLVILKPHFEQFIGCIPLDLLAKIEIWTPIVLVLVVGECWMPFRLFTLMCLLEDAHTLLKYSLAPSMESVH